MQKLRYKITPAVFLVLIKDDKILLLRRFNTGYEDGKYTFVAGHVEEHEMPMNALIREAKEEANITLKKSYLKLVHTMYRQGNDGMRIDLFFQADRWEGEITNLEPNKCDELAWFELNSLPSNTLYFIKSFLSSFKDKLLYSEVK